MGKKIQIGIDLGTSNSVVCAFIDGKSTVIPNSSGDRTTPSIVAYTKDGDVLVGAAAKRQAITNPENTFYEVKRLMGRKISDEEVQNDIPLVGYKIVANAENQDARVQTKEGKQLSPPEISAKILAQLKKDAENFLGEKVTDAVITVPAYFNDSQRQATKDAGRIAGLNVTRIINEPTAAALAFGFDNKQNRTIFAVDIGGSTCDYSVIIQDVTSDSDDGMQFVVEATSGDSGIGGKEVDQRLMEYVVSEFEKDTGINLKNDLLALQRLKDAAERAKIELSNSQQTDINLPYISADATGPKHLTLKLTRAKLESLTEDLIERMIAPMKIALKDANLKTSDITDVILVGGQTRMPKIQQVVAEFFGKEPRKDINPDEAVAIGAALQGGVLSGEVKDVLLLDVTPLSLGLETMGGVFTKIIEKNTTIPTRSSQVFSTADDNQPTVTIHVLQGEREQAQYNKSLARFDLSGIAPAPRGTPQIEVTFDIDANGIIHVSAKDKNTGKEQKVEVKAGSGLSEQDIQRMVQDAQNNAEQDRKFHELVGARNQADHLIYSTRKLITDNGAQFGPHIGAIEGAIAELETAMKGDNKSSIESKTQNLQSVLAQAQQGQAGYAEDTPNDDVIDADFKDVSKDD